MSVTGDDLLDLRARARAEGVRWDVEDGWGNVIGVVHPMPGATISFDPKAAVPRTIQQLNLVGSDVDDFDPRNDRLAPRWLLSSGDEYDLGLFVATSSRDARTTAGRTRQLGLGDLCVLLAGGLPSSLSWTITDTIEAAIAQTLELAGFIEYEVPTSSTPIGAPLSFPRGTAGTQVVNALGLKAALAPVYPDATGRMVVQRTPDPTIDAPTVVLEEGEGCRVVQGTVVEGDDSLTKPTHYVVSSSLASGTSVAGIYGLPASSPQSSSARGGFVSVATTEIAGLTTQGQCVAAARQLAVRDQIKSVTWELSTTPDPRHGAYEVVQFADEVLLETAWSLVCAPGGAHNLKLASVAA